MNGGDQHEADNHEKVPRAKLFNRDGLQAAILAGISSRAGECAEVLGKPDKGRDQDEADQKAPREAGDRAAYKGGPPGFASSVQPEFELSPLRQRPLCRWPSLPDRKSTRLNSSHAS